LLHGAAAGTDQQVDVSDLVAVADERLADTGTSNLGHETEPSLNADTTKQLTPPRIVAGGEPTKVLG
jgi:hypothetical protein